MKTEQWVLSRAELAYVAMATGQQRLLYCDGGLGLLHVGADLDGAGTTLRARGLIPDRSASAGPPGLDAWDFLRTLDLIDDARIRVSVLNDGDGVRRNHLLALAGVLGASVETVEPATAEHFAVSKLEADRLRNRVFELVGFDGPGALSDPAGSNGRKGVSGEVKVADLARVHATLHASSAEDAVGLLVDLGWESGSARALVADMVHGPRANEVTMSRREGTRVELAQLCWNTTDQGGWWRYERFDNQRRLRLIRVTRREIASELESLLEPLA